MKLIDFASGPFNSADALDIENDAEIGGNDISTEVSAM